MNYYDILLAKKLNGGGSSVEVEPLSVTENGTYSEEGKAYSPVNVNVSQGTTEIEPKDINFFDYDGTCLYAYSQDEWANVTELPTNPSHNGLVAQGWNWTKAEIDEQLRDVGGCVQVGQMYDTVDGSTEIDIDLFNSDRLSLYLNAAINGSILINWGDNTSDTVTGSSLTTEKNTKHTYASVGTYTIKVSKVSGNYSFRSGTSSRPMINNGAESMAGASIISLYVKHIRFGSSVSSLYGSCLIWFGNLEWVTMPSTLTNISGATSVFNLCKSIKIIIAPRGTADITKVSSCNSLRTLCLPFSSTVFPLGTGCSELTNICIPKNVTTYYASISNNNIKAKKIHIPPSITSFTGTGSFLTAEFATEIVFSGNVTTYGSGNYAFISSPYSLTKFSLPSTVTQLGNCPFKYWNSMKEYHFKSTTVPTLGNSSGFSGIPSDCIIYVPYSADHSILNAYKTASNWSTYASQIMEEPQ